MPRHSETRHVPYSAQQMYDLVADVARYPEFLPWTAAARVRSATPRPDGSVVMEADMVISFKVFREKFGSRVVLWPEARKINTEYIDGPFSHMRSDWAFAEDAAGGSTLSFFVDFGFRNAILQAVIGVVFDEAMRQVVRAFERRAADLYGRAA